MAKDRGDMRVVLMPCADVLVLTALVYVAVDMDAVTLVCSD